MSKDLKSKTTEPEHWLSFTQAFESQKHSVNETVRTQENITGFEELQELLPHLSMDTVLSDSNSTKDLQKPGIPRARQHSFIREPLEFVLGEMLAQGGMGRICKARQTPLYRDVVVKMLRLDKRSEKAAGRLLQEALLTGILEHPNIIPIYSLGKDENDEPMLVMKRIEGVTWHDVLQKRKDDPESLPPEQRGLEWHIRILLQVCNALEFAHSKQIVHRDLKPENVMIGEFGEVYLLDWGIALSLEEDEERPLPSIFQAKGIAGTPGYMAPEMLASHPKEIDKRTDVYLLGSSLHHILTGSPPHRGGGRFMELLGQICTRGHFKYGPDIPSELAVICNQAMNLQKEHRFQNVREFRAALEQFLTYREAYELVEETDRLLDELKGHLERVSSMRDKLPEDFSQDEELGSTISALFWRCHFGYKQALRIWPGGQKAMDSMQKLVEWMIEHELAQKNTKGAENLFAELPMPNQELVNRLDALRIRQLAEEEELEAIRRLQFEQAAEIGAKARRIIVYLGCSLLGLACYGIYFLEKMELFTPGHQSFLNSHLLSVGFLAGVTVIFRKVFFRNKYNRRLWKITVLMAFTLIVYRVIHIWQGHSISISGGIDFLMMFVLTSCLAIFLDMRLLVMAFGYLLTGVAIFVWPSELMVFLGIAHTISAFNLAWVWRDTQEAST